MTQRTVDLTGIVTPAPSQSPTEVSAESLPKDNAVAHAEPPARKTTDFFKNVSTDQQRNAMREIEEGTDEPRRKGFGGLRISQAQSIQGRLESRYHVTT